MSNDILACFDGGGIRGLAAMKFYSTFLQNSQPVQPEYFGGTSVGAIIAASLAFGKSSNDTLNWFKGNVNRIFKRDVFRMIQCLDNILGPKYNGAGLKECLSEFFHNVKLSDSLYPLFIVSYDASSSSPVVFSSLNGDHKDLLLVDCLMASTAAQTFFPPYEFNGGVYVDGGTASNAPGQLIYSLLKEDNIKLLSIGCGDSTQPLNRKDIGGGGTLSWMRHILDLLFDGTEEVSDVALRNNLGDKYVRINKQGIKNIKLDDTSDQSIDYLLQLGLDLYKNNREKLDKFLSIN